MHPPDDPMHPALKQGCRTTHLLQTAEPCRPIRPDMSARIRNLLGECAAPLGDFQRRVYSNRNHRAALRLDRELELQATVPRPHLPQRAPDVRCLGIGAAQRHRIVPPVDESPPRVRAEPVWVSAVFDVQGPIAPPRRQPVSAALDPERNARPFAGHVARQRVQPVEASRRGRRTQPMRFPEWPYLPPFRAEAGVRQYPQFERQGCRYAGAGNRN